MLLKQEQTLKHPAPALSLPPNLRLSLSLSIFLCKMLVWILHRDFHKRGLWPSLRMVKGDWFILQIWFNGPKSVIKRQLLIGSQFVGDYVKHNVQSSNHAQNFSNLIYHKIKKISFKKNSFRVIQVSSALCLGTTVLRFILFYDHENELYWPGMFTYTRNLL